MKKNAVIGILILFIAFAMTYAKIKANEAEYEAENARQLKEQVEELSKLAEQQKALALEAAAEAAMQRAMAEEAIAECESRNK
ncbi:hypothetical protein [Ekhidna sp.]|uniref:hypothetical protein n=1 Tax=Ekhidna sp. TaxID=2608089 RepID=UPI003B512BC7